MVKQQDHNENKDREGYGDIGYKTQLQINYYNGKQPKKMDIENLLEFTKDSNHMVNKIMKEQNLWIWNGK
ncbi:unnamed protein product (macronuclear) [Paramecium tetraurelia]|uniref:Uncharacterized protein n=1 Tax=Paramecium tetraurelia TaxID=5888 RepID=A0EH12_PARTE|nr:uncharacterized protein GSPATT00026927001 [Paramecium tetraurelia]CAK94603.1 unnamed protein product [Paramecium tetraurelia]|eukprot:XP_001461976.1 hypothetical protein (macronuclear) [Paramecium tetraurelia strain d4-2]